jgi:F0F1-type ATP synthase epsilon subunit
MAEPTFFESLMKTLKVGEPPKKSKKEYTIPETSPLFGGTTLEFSSEIDPDILKQREKEADRDRKRRDEQAKKSLVKETVDAAKTTEEEVPLPKPPKPPKTGQTNNETGTGGTEGTVETQPKGGTIVADKVYDDDALRPKRSLMTRYKRRGLLSRADADTMLN